MKCVCSMWFPHFLQDRETEHRRSACLENLAQISRDPDFHSGDHGEGSSIVVDTEKLNFPRPSPRSDELSQILKMVSQTLIFLMEVKKIEEIHG